MLCVFFFANLNFKADEQKKELSEYLNIWGREREREKYNKIWSLIVTNIFDFVFSVIPLFSWFVIFLNEQCLYNMLSSYTVESVGKHFIFCFYFATYFKAPKFRFCQTSINSWANLTRMNKLLLSTLHHITNGVMKNQKFRIFSVHATCHWILSNQSLNYDWK